MKSQQKLTLLSVFVVAACGSDTTDAPAGPTPVALMPGEVCEADNRPPLHLTFDPPTVVVAPGATRPVRLTVEPDLCDPSTGTFTTSSDATVAAPATANFDLRHATYDFMVKGGAAGKATITVSMPTLDANGAATTATLDLPVDVRAADAPACAPGESASGTLNAATPKVNGSGALAKAYVSVNPNAFVRTDEFAFPETATSIGCNADIIGDLPDAKLIKLGPAVTVGGPSAKPLRREVEVGVPVNPAAFPTPARLRHLVVLYQGPRAKVARAIQISNPRIDADGDGYVLKFSTPWLGTYQAAVAPEAGTVVRHRHLSHRAVIGVSMGGEGAAVFGLRHHDQFDAIGPLGGPSDWTWLLWYIETYALGGFCKAGQTPCTTTAPNLYPIDEPFAHTMDYDHWFYQTGGGNGGTFNRGSYLSLISDLSISMGNANGVNKDPNLAHIVPGPTINDPFIVGDPEYSDPKIGCTIAMDSIDEDADHDQQSARQQKCNAVRCDPKNQWVAPTGYYDDEYNPDGSLPVSTFCDGAQNGTTPYVDTFAPGGTTPVSMGVFVDLNKNGTRDMGEPIIRSGREPFDDCGADGLCDAQEPGYDASTNPDPNQDDYDALLAPNGTENNKKWDTGEPFKDYGVDGVPDTASKHVAGDYGENDGLYTESPGLVNFRKRDPHDMLGGRLSDIPAGPITDDKLARLSVLLDGGVRDLFNLGVVSQQLSGQIAGRLGANKLPIRSVATYNGFQYLPGEPIDKPDNFQVNLIRWADVANAPFIRYGDLDANEQMIKNGDGQHVGTVNQILFRIETAFYFVSQQWPDADRLQTTESRNGDVVTKPELGDCEVRGSCEKIFTGPTTGRTGPIAISLPPGYALKENVERNVRYPVLYVLHGYGQDPRDLEAVAVFTNNFMNLSERSYVTRMPKFIIVYVDGRCREGKGGLKSPECVRGDWYMNAVRDGGVQADDWFEEVIDYVDQTYRTMPPSDVDVTD